MENSAVPPGEASPSGSTLTSISTPLSPPSLTLSSRSPSKTPSFDEGLNAFLWRSPRRRSAPERFTSENFRGKSKEKEHSRNPRQPGGKRQQGSMGGCVQGSVKYCGEERERKQEELGALRKSQLDSLRFVRERERFGVVLLVTLSSSVSVPTTPFTPPSLLLPPPTHPPSPSLSPQVYS